MAARELAMRNQPTHACILPHVLPAKVKDVKYDHQKVLQFAKGTEIVVHRFACLGPGDILTAGAQNRGGLFVRCKNGLARVRPIYRRAGSLKIGSETLEITFKEITSNEELSSYERLADFHYRGDVLHGRRVPIVAVVDHPLLPKVIAYVELATSFLMNKPRSKVLDGPFSDGNGISWRRWNLRAMQTKTNVIVRIARCVVYPEFRGLGLSRLLLNHAFRYAASHWQVAALKPYFIEITADMLKYLPFAEKAGMHFIGFTEGNLKRVKKDMAYILKNYSRVEHREILREETGGIVDLQVSYATKLKHIVSNGGPGLREALRLMNFRGDYVSLRQYNALHQILRLPKPTYLRGLTKPAEQFITERIETLGVSKRESAEKQENRPITSPFLLKDLTVTVTARVAQTRKTRAIQEAFGIKPAQLEYALVSNLSVELSPKKTLLIVGPSGAGKTLLLSTVAGRIEKLRRHPGSRVRIEGEVSRPTDMKLGLLTKLTSRKPLIELFGGKSIDRAIYLLNMAGLSEAYLYLKRFQELSAGQQYRAMIAKMADRQANVWVADEFCSTLDPVTAYIVAENLRRLARRFGATLIVAAAHWNYFVEALAPDIVVYLMSSREHRIFPGRDFLRIRQKLDAPEQ
ncbi:MAG TPA: ATP-binding cassette domain-containing protein [Candidatus Acidoferrum sp.]|nr:ATP-binding cassette domain-containing protein [Candidatus Acidoferrum sp.]